MIVDPKEQQEVLYILKQLGVVAAATETICEDILSPERLSMGRVMCYRYLCLNLYLWRGYLSRLEQTSQADFAKGLLKDFNQKVYKNSDPSHINLLRNCAAHYDASCDMDVMVAIKRGKRINLSEYLASYNDIKKYFHEVNWKVGVLYAKLTGCDFCS